MILENNGRALVLTPTNNKDLHLVTAFLHLDHFLQNYTDSSFETALELIAMDEPSIEDLMNELSHEIAGDSAFDEKDDDAN